MLTHQTYCLEVVTDKLMNNKLTIAMLKQLYCKQINSYVKKTCSNIDFFPEKLQLAKKSNQIFVILALIPFNSNNLAGPIATTSIMAKSARLQRWQFVII